MRFYEDTFLTRRRVIYDSVFLSLSLPVPPSLSLPLFLLRPYQSACVFLSLPSAPPPSQPPTFVCVCVFGFDCTIQLISTSYLFFPLPHLSACLSGCGTGNSAAVTLLSTLTVPVYIGYIGWLDLPRVLHL